MSEQWPPSPYGSPQLENAPGPGNRPEPAFGAAGYDHPTAPSPVAGAPDDNRSLEHEPGGDIPSYEPSGELTGYGPGGGPPGYGPIPGQAPLSYGRPPYPPCGPAVGNGVPAAPTSTMAALSLSLGIAILILGPLTCGALTFLGIIPVVLGHLAVRETGVGGKRGRGLAIASLTMGYLSLVMVLFTLAFWFLPSR
jgi:hypothetical protein